MDQIKPNSFERVAFRDALLENYFQETISKNYYSFMNWRSLSLRRLPLFFLL